MSEEFVIKRVRRRRLKGKAINVVTPSPPSSLTPVPKEINGENVIHAKQDSVLPEYLMDPPPTPDRVVLEGNHTKELVCSYRVAKEVLGSSFRPKESNLAVGKIRV